MHLIEVQPDDIRSRELKDGDELVVRPEVPFFWQKCSRCDSVHKVDVNRRGDAVVLVFHYRGIYIVDETTTR